MLLAVGLEDPVFLDASRVLGQFMSAHLPPRPPLAPPARPLARLFVAALCLIGLAVNCVIVGPSAFHSAFQGQNDFKLFYIGGKLAGSESLYDQNRVLEAQREAFGESNRKLMPVRLPFYYAFLSPLARLPYKLALLLWAASNCWRSYCSSACTRLRRELISRSRAVGRSLCYLALPSGKTSALCCCC